MANNLPVDPTANTLPTGVVEQPSTKVEQTPAIDAQQAPVKKAKDKEEGLTQTMGNLPQWKTILQDNSYRNSSSGEQNKYREKWLQGISDVNPNMDKKQLRDLRSKVYTTDYNIYPAGDWNKTTAEELYASVGTKAKQIFEKPPDTELPPTIEGGGEKIKKIVPSDRIGVTGFEKFLAKSFNRGVNLFKKHGKNAPIYKKAVTIKSGVDDFLKKLPELGNNIEREIERQVKHNEIWRDTTALIDKTLASVDYVLGGLKGATIKEQRKARNEGRHKYYRELPTDSRIKILKDMIESPEEWSGMPDDVKNVVLNEMLPAGYSLKEIDQFIFDGIKTKKLSEIGFYYGMGKDTKMWDIVKNPLAMLGMGLAGVPGFDHEAGAKAFWEGIIDDDDIRKHVDASAVREQLKGKTFEEQYGLLKGTLANIGLTILADPLIWADLGSNKVKRLTKASLRLITGQAGLQESRITMETLIKLSGRDAAKPYIYQAKNIVDDMLKIQRDPNFQRSMKIMDSISDKFQKIPSNGKLKALVEKTQGSRLPALLQERFGKADDIITDIHKVTQLDDAGKIKKVADIRSTKQLPGGKAIPLKGDKAIPLLGDVKPTRTISLGGDVGEQIGAPLKRAELPPARIAGELTEGGIPVVGKESLGVVDDIPTSNIPVDETIQETIARRERELSEMGEATDDVRENVARIMDEIRESANGGKIRIMDDITGRSGSILKGTVVRDAHLEALDNFLTKGEKTKRLAPEVGKKRVDMSKIGEEVGDIFQPRANTEGGLDLIKELDPSHSSVRRGAKYEGEAGDTSVGALAQMLARRKSGTIGVKKIDNATGELIDGVRKLTNDELKQLDKTITGLKKDVASIRKAEKKNVGRTKLTKTEKELAELDFGVKNKQKSNRKVVMRKNKDGSRSVYRKFGTTWKKTGEVTKNPNGEYLGSIFGYAQKFFDQRAARRALGKTAIEELDELNKGLKKSYISLEKQFSNFPIVGKSVKNMYSSKDAIQEHGLMRMKEISGQSLTRRWSKLTADDMIDIPLLREDKKLVEKLSLAERERVEPILKQVDDFLEDFKQRYAEKGVDVNFKDHLRDRWIEENRAIQEMMSQIKSGSKKYVGKKDLAMLGIEYSKEGYNPRNLREVRKVLADNYFSNEKMIAELKNFEYVPIPHAQWFETGYDKLAFAKAMKIANAQGRKTFRIADLIESGAIERDQVNLMDILAAYTQRASNDLPLLDVKLAMKKSGLAFDFSDFANKTKGALREAITVAKKKGWVKPDPRRFPMWSKTMMHPGMWEWLEYFKYEKLNATKFDSAMSHIKVWQFANPFFLPYYDMMQGIVARGPLGALNPLGMGRDMLWAMKTMKNRPREYWDLMHAGLQSKPMAMPFNQWVGELNKLKNTNAGSYMWQLTKEAVGTGGLRPIYEASWNTAWGLDKMVRLSTAKYMMRKGMSTFDAAQFSALIHSDYANVPMKFRRNFNRVFFTPTFKITMFRLYKEMMKNMLRVPLKKMTGRGAELSLQEKQLAKAGLTTVLGAMVGMDLFLTNKGYIRDQFARRYYKNVRDEKGSMKEDVIVFASPLTMAPKYAYKLGDIMKENYRDNKAMQIFDSFKWDIHPVWRISMDIAQNRKDNGDKIWQPFGDSEPIKYAKMAEYAATSALAIIKQIGLKDEPDDQQEAWDLYKKDMGQIFSFISAPTTFAYLRDPKVIRYVKKLERTKRDWKRAMSDARKEGRWNKNLITNGHKKVISASQDLRKAVEQAEKINDQATWNGWKRDQNKRVQ